MTRTPIILGFGLCFGLTACGGKISSDVPIDTGTVTGSDGGTTADGGADTGVSDGGTSDTGTTGTTSDDLDGDGWSVAAGDCDDTDDTIYPQAPDDCYDGVDSNCDGADDNDCDGDGYYPTELKGDDCDDTDADIYPGASETRANGVDNNCDGVIDEDAYCNLFAPLSNESSSYRTYEVFFDGTTYTESDSLTGFSETDNTVTLERILDDGAGGGMTISEDWGCDTDGAAQVTGYTVSSSGYDLGTMVFSAASKRALPQAEMVEGATWTFDYTSVESTSGTTMWDVTGTATVLKVDNIEITAGIFATVPVQVTYVLRDYSSLVGNSSGTVTWYIAPGLGVVYSIDTLDDHTLSEERELTAYDGFYVTDPADITGR